MEPIHIFYKELPIDKNNIFTANLAEKNEVEEVKFKTSKEYALTGLSISQDIDSNIAAVTDTDSEETISNLTQKLIREKKDPDLDLRSYNEETFEKINLHFTKRLQKKEEEVEFYNYMLHLENYGFEWEDTSLEFKYSVRFSTSKKGLIKKISMGKTIRKIIFLHESRVWSFAVN